MPKNKPAATLQADQASVVLDCGCKLEGTKEGDVLLYHCPMHTHAEAVRSVLAELVDLDLNTALLGVADRDLLDKARAVLTKAEGG